MIFRILLFIFPITALFANGIYNSNLLDIQAKVYPKIIIYDKELEKKTLEGKIIFTIFYEDIDYNMALIFKDKIEKSYKSLKGLDFFVKLKKMDDFDKKEPLSTAYYFLLGDKNQISLISNFLAMNNRLTFSYDDRYLEFGVIFSLKINSQIDLFLNLQELKNSKVELESSIFNAVKIR